MTDPTEGWPALPNVDPPTDLPRGLATTAMVLGIAGLVLLLWIGVWLPTILAVILGLIALRRIQSGRAGGRRRAMAGIVTGGLGMAHIVITLTVMAPLLQAT